MVNLYTICSFYVLLKNKIIKKHINYSLLDPEALVLHPYNYNDTCEKKFLNVVKDFILQTSQEFMHKFFITNNNFMKNFKNYLNKFNKKDLSSSIKKYLLFKKEINNVRILVEKLYKEYLSSSDTELCVESQEKINILIEKITSVHNTITQLRKEVKNFIKRKMRIDGLQSYKSCLKSISNLKKNYLYHNKVLNLALIDFTDFLTEFVTLLIVKEIEADKICIITNKFRNELKNTCFEYIKTGYIDKKNGHNFVINCIKKNWKKNHFENLDGQQLIDEKKNVDIFDKNLETKISFLMLKLNKILNFHGYLNLICDDMLDLSNNYCKIFAINDIKTAIFDILQENYSETHSELNLIENKLLKKTLTNHEIEKIIADLYKNNNLLDLDFTICSFYFEIYYNTKTHLYMISKIYFFNIYCIDYSNIHSLERDYILNSHIIRIYENFLKNNAIKSILNKNLVNEIGQLEIFISKIKKNLFRIRKTHNESRNKKKIFTKYCEIRSQLSDLHSKIFFNIFFSFLAQKEEKDCNVKGFGNVFKYKVLFCFMAYKIKEDFNETLFDIRELCYRKIEYLLKKYSAENLSNDKRILVCELINENFKELFFFPKKNIEHYFSSNNFVNQSIIEIILLVFKDLSKIFYIKQIMLENEDIYIINEKINIFKNKI